MGKDLCSSFPVAKHVFEEANEALGWSLSNVMFTTDKTEQVNLTPFAQPAILVFSIALFEIFKEVTGLKITDFSFVSGHSLGEFTALVASESMSLKTGVHLVHLRGAAMQACVPSGVPFSMNALLGTSLEDVQETIDEIKSERFEPKLQCSIANYNALDQVVISGRKDCVDKVILKAKQTGKARHIRAINVSAPFHSEFMCTAADLMQPPLVAAIMQPPVIPFLSNVDVDFHVRPPFIKDLLFKQIYSTVQWCPIMDVCNKIGTREFLEIGPKQVLTPLLRRHFVGNRIISCSGLDHVLQFNDVQNGKDVTKQVTA